MISRKRILSNSCTHLSSDTSRTSKGCNFDEDVWFDKHSLFRDHIQEILNKYNQLDDEIWGKIICMERNRRVAKAYARSPVITIDNGTVGFDGDSIGLGGFESPFRDSEILITHKSIGSGVAIGADEAGNILIQLIQQRTLYLRQVSSTCVDDPLIKSNGKLKPGTVYKIFCMKKFLTKLNSLQCSTDNSKKSKSAHSNLSNVRFRKQSNESNGNIHGTVKKGSNGNLSGDRLKSKCSGGNKSAIGKSSTLRPVAANNGANSYRRHSADDDEEDDDDDEDDEDELTRVNLENQCFTVISLSSHPDGEMTPLLDTPVWIIVINIIALEMLHRNLNLIDSSSSDLASSWSCSSCSTSCCEVERTNKCFSLTHHKSTGALNTPNSGVHSTGASRCHRCKHLSLPDNCPSGQSNEKMHHTSKGRSMDTTRISQVSSASERLSKLFIPLDSARDSKKAKSVGLNECHETKKGKCTDGKCKHCQCNSWRQEEEDDDDDQVDSSFSLSHSSSSTSNSSNDNVKCKTSKIESLSDRKGKMMSVKSKKCLKKQDEEGKSFNMNSLQGNLSSSSSNGYALSSETTNSTANSTTNSNKLPKRGADNDEKHHFIGHFNKSIDCDGQKYLFNNYKNNGNCTNCHCDCSSGNNVNGKENGKGSADSVNNGRQSTNKSKFLSNNGTYNCNSSSSSSSSFSSSFTSNGSGRNSTDASAVKSKLKGEAENVTNISPSSGKVMSSLCNQLINSSVTCPDPKESKTTTSNSNASAHSVTNGKQDQLSASIALDTHFQEQVEPDDQVNNRVHCTRGPQESKNNDESAHRRSKFDDDMKSVPSSCTPDRRTKCNNGSDTRRLHSTIPTPDYDDSGNENYGFIGQRSGFGGNRLRLCTSNLLLNDNWYPSSSNGANFYIDSQLNKRLTRSTHHVNERRIEEECCDDGDEEMYPMECISTHDTLRRGVNSGFLNSVLRHLPLSTITSKQGRSGKYSLNYHSSWKRLSFPALFNNTASAAGHNESYLTPSMSSAGDSDNSYTHIYSSICDSAVGTSASIKSNSLYRRNTQKSISGYSSGYVDYNSDNKMAKNSMKRNTFITRMLSKSKGNTLNHMPLDESLDTFGKSNGAPSNGTMARRKVIEDKKYATMSMPSISLDEETFKGKHVTLNGNVDESCILGRRPRSRSHQTVDNHLSAFNDATGASSSHLTVRRKLYSMPNSIDNVHGDEESKSTPVTATTVRTNGLAKLARKGSKGLKRATSIPKTLKLFIKRNGKRAPSE